MARLQCLKQVTTARDGTGSAVALLKRSEVRKIFKRHYGSIGLLAKDLGLPNHTALTLVLQGKRKTPKLMEACRARALELLEQEKADGH
jgi:hypothetical protein